MSDLLRHEEVGSGAYGIVYSASPKPYNSPETVELPTRALKRNFKDSTASWVGCIRELDNLVKVRDHPYVVHLLRVRFDDPFASTGHPLTPNRPKSKEMKNDRVHFEFELMSTSGSKYIYASPTRNFYFIKVIIVQLLLSLEFIHGRGLIHRDLKPDNILLNFEKGCPTVSDPTGSIKLPITKIADFGLSKIECRLLPSTPGVQTSWYRAPEVCGGRYDYTNSIDVWSLGCCIYEFIKRRPYVGSPDDSSEAVMQAIIERLPSDPANLKEIIKSVGCDPNTASARKDMKTWLSLTEEEIAEFNITLGNYTDFVPLLENMLQFDQTKRIDCTSALNSKFFDGYREYIGSVRERYPPTRAVSSTITVSNSKERKWAVNEAIEIYNSQATKRWYRHDILFHAIEIFDRYLEWLCVHSSAGGCTTATPSLTKHETLSRFYVCIYMMHKYYCVICPPLRWTDIFPVEYTDDEKSAFATEKTLLQDVLRYAIHNETFLEIRSRYPGYLGSTEIGSLLYSYCSVDNFKGTMEQLYVSRISLGSTQSDQKTPPAPDISGR